MANNFKIFMHRNNDNLHLKLKGDFDGSSAFELIKVLEKQNSDVKKIFIHTCSLSSVHPFGREVFQNNCPNLNNPSNRLIFTGKYENKFAPQGSRLH